MMSAQSKAEHGVIQSSIGLLQERFRQLQRMKEMRENKQLVTMFSDYKTTNTNNNATSTVTVTPPIFSATSNSNSNNNYLTTTSTNSTGSNNKNNNNNNNNGGECSIRNNENEEDELQIFIPPNYMSNKNRKLSCYSSPSAASSTISLLSSSSSSQLSQSQSNHHKTKLNDVCLSLWPPTADQTVRGSVKEVVNRPSSVSTALNLDDSQHFSDVDTTLHL
ncbi:hypothetical protein RND81_06G143900 [Saponaria officinalis]|uniref:Uncharacterized protein n=1 Tax=Saponaria officinalis TaxID=3572 RepID=A0AAW1KB19_SAPOF